MGADRDVIVGLTEAEHRRQLRRAVLAGTIGTAIEWYDFFLYSTVTGLVFAPLYFPHAARFVGTLEAFGIYAVGFLARPIGAAIFGTLRRPTRTEGRLGRDSPADGNRHISGGARAHVRANRRVGRRHAEHSPLRARHRRRRRMGRVGSLSMEWAQSNRHRGFIASWPQFGVPVGLFLRISRCLDAAHCRAINS